jgi:hypothetical protein
MMCLAALATTVAAQDEELKTEPTGTVGIRFGVGTDIEGGLALGGQISYILFKDMNAIELGLGVFGGSYEETSDNGSNTYNETTDLLVIGAMGNYLFRYSLDASGPYFIVGAGVGVVSVSWEETSDTDTSLGTPLPGGGSMQSEDGSAGGVLLNFGIGHRFNRQFDLRAAIPTFFIGGSDERDGKVIPTFTLTAGLNFR